MESAISSLNPAQREAVLSEAKVLQVLAPPGSGKTKTLTARVGHLIASGLPPWSIIVCTFTVKAAREMQHRIQELVENSESIKIGTFHGIALRFLRKHRHLVGLDDAFGVADTTDSIAILRRIVKLRAASIEPGAARSRISGLKAKGLDVETYAKGEGKRPELKVFLQIYQDYEAELKRGRLLDYDDLLLRCVDLLRLHPDCVQGIQAVLVDEFQDTNNVQYELMSLFAQKQQNITIVGDPDQSIYGWRSAEIRNLHRMRQHWPDTLTMNLEENYRSAGSILIAAQTIIEQDQHRPPKTLQATLSYGHKPVLRRLPGARDEATWLVQEIRRTQALTGGMLKYSDFAVLLRTASLSRVIESALGSSGIPYRMVGGVKFFERVEVKLVLDYLRVIDSPSHNEALARVLNVPPRRIGDKTLETLQVQAQKKTVTVWSLVHGIATGRLAAPAGISQPARQGLEQFTNVILTCRKRLEDQKASIVDIIKLITQKISLQSYLRGKYAEDYESRWTGVEDLMQQAAEQLPSKVDASQEESQPADTNSTVAALTDFLANATLASSVDEKAAGTTPELVTISTMHAAKGLEWPVVFVPACYNGSIPHSRAEDHDEERRLLYVAMTRAQAMLYLSCPLKDVQRQDTALSTFLDQSGYNKLFEDRGPPISKLDSDSLAQVLRREPPSIDEIRQSSSQLLRDHDDFWPTDGSPAQYDNQQLWPGSGLGQRLTTSACSGPPGECIPPTGFASVRSQFNELVQQGAESGKNGRAVTLSVSKPAKPASQQTQRGSISSFFTSTRPDVVSATTMQQMSGVSSACRKRPLTDITSATNNATTIHTSMSTHLPRNEPLNKRKREDKTALQSNKIYDPYIMLSSSPVAAGADAEDLQKHQLKSDSAGTGSQEFKTASTTHVTSYHSATSVRKTLGVRRSLHGWAQRGQARHDAAR